MEQVAGISQAGDKTGLVQKAAQKRPKMKSKMERRTAK
jgi:hypothetical protein